MSTQSNAYCYGSAALKIDAPFLVLHEGGRNGSDARHCSAEGVKPMGLRAILLCVFASIAIFAGALYLQDRAASSVSRALGQLPTSEHVVRDGETLWEIASGCGLDGVSTRDVVEWISQSNSLGGGAIYAGQRLAVPQYVASPR